MKFSSTMGIAATDQSCSYCVSDQKGWGMCMWKQRWIRLLALFVLLFFVAACSDSHVQQRNEGHHQLQTNQQNKQNVSAELKVELQLPDRIPVNQELILKARLTQGTEPVHDAQEVQFEVWKENQKKKSEKIAAKLEKDGIYTAKKQFQEAGVYYIQAHATARGMHVMPVKKLVVGEEDQPNNASDQDQSLPQEHHH